MERGALTVFTVIKPDHLQTLTTYLEGIGGDIDNVAGKTADVIPFNTLKNVHFMRWVVVNGSADPFNPGTTRPAQLVLETNFDGALTEHLDELIAKANQVLHRIYEHCQDYPDPADRSPATVKAYLERHMLPLGAFYVGTRELSVDQIRDDQRLRQEIETFLDGRRRTPPGWLGNDAAAMRDEIRSHLRGSAFDRALSPLPSPSVISRILSFMGGLLQLLPWALILLGPGLLAAWAAGVSGWAILWGPIGFAALLAVALLLHEWLEDKTPIQENHQKTREVARNEDHLIQNQMTDVVFVKRGLFRQLLLRSVLWTINWLARHVYNKGELGGIPSIHFARWVIFDEGRRLAFFSNFDGSWESYLDDFIDKAAGGLTAVWSNAYQFPKSYLLYFGGARDEQKFKHYVRDTQMPTQVWYSAYPDLSVQNVNDNARVRKMLSGNPSLKEVETCLRLL